jgi:glycosyltransferase involved in cell wall biosynthesis
VESSEWSATVLSPPWSRVRQQPTNECASFRHLELICLHDVYREADVLILPALYDVWGLVVNEAQGCGLPVITTDQVGAAADWIDPGVTGLIVPAGSVDAFAGAMRELGR